MDYESSIMNNYRFMYELNSEDITRDTIGEFRSGQYGIMVIRNADNNTVELFGDLLPQDMHKRTKVTIGHDDEAGDRLQHTHDMLWHQDRAYHKDVHQFVGLYCIRADAGSSGTYFADMSAVYTNSSDKLKAAADGVECLHSITKYMEQEEYPYEFETELQKRFYRKKNRATHPLVCEDAFGKYYFYSPAYTTTPFEREINSMIDYSPQYVHMWQPNDLLVYNNFKIIHKRDNTNPNVVRQHVRYAIR